MLRAGAGQALCNEFPALAIAPRQKSGNYEAECSPMGPMVISAGKERIDASVNSTWSLCSDPLPQVIAVPL